MKPYLIPFFATVALTATAQQKNEITSVLEILDVTNGNRTVVKEFPTGLKLPIGRPTGNGCYTTAKESFTAFPPPRLPNRN